MNETQALIASIFSDVRSEAQASCEEFAERFGHLPNVEQGMSLAREGRISWTELEEIFRVALAKGISSVR